MFFAVPGIWEKLMANADALMTKHNGKKKFMSTWVRHHESSKFMKFL
jgi:hypothetical protein